MSATAVSAGAAAVRGSGSPIDMGSRGAASEQSSSSDFPDLISKMASAENEPQGHAATLRPSWSTSRGPTRTQGDAEVDHDAALAQLLAFKGSEGRDGTDQSSVALPSASQQAAEPSVDGTGGGGSAITAWQGVLQAQGLIALGVSSPQTPAAGFGASDSAQCSGMDTATLIQLARDAQAAGVPASRVPPSTLNDPSQPPTWNAITPQGGQTSGAAVTQETHFAPGPASQVAQALPAGQDADQAPDATSVRQNTRASANPGSAAAVPATTVAQTQSMQPALRSLDRAASASPPDDGAGAMPPESPHPHGGSPGTVRAIDPATAKPHIQRYSSSRPSHDRRACRPAITSMGSSAGMPLQSMNMPHPPRPARRHIHRAPYQRPRIRLLRRSSPRPMPSRAN
jgi:hypothetical protein